MKAGASMMFLLVCAVMVATSSAASAADARAAEAKGTIETVTVYRGQAMVTRAVPIDGPAGPVELVVLDLPERIIPESLYASSRAAVIRAVRYRARAVREELRDDVRKLSEQIDAAQASLRANQAAQNLAAQQGAYLDNLGKFTATKTSEDINRGTLNAETITKLTPFLFEQRAALSTRAVELTEEALKLQKQLSLLERQRSELASRLTRTAREAVLTLEKTGPAAGTVHLHYLVSEASWSPMYNLRAGAERSKVNLECNALIRQTSGEDWTGVRLTLSTASPAMAAEAPILTPLWVTLSSGPAPQSDAPAAVYRGQQEAATKLRKALQQRSSAFQPQIQTVEQDWAANTWANRLQFLDLLAERDVLLVRREPLPTDEALSVDYKLAGQITLPSRSDQQMVQIAAPELPAEFYYVAAPLLTPYVYRQARVSNTSDLAMLSGPVSVYVDGQFMGKGRIPMVAKGQKFLAGFGVDSQLRADRQLADKTDRISWGNRELTFTYRLLIENYKDTPVEVRVMDRLPTAQGAEVDVTLIEASDPVSDDVVYQRTLRKVGILQWKVNVPAKAAGESARTILYTYRMSFDRNLNLAEPTARELEKRKREFSDDLMNFSLQ